MEMFASFDFEIINGNNLRYGIIFNGYSGNKKVVLCQHRLFPYGNKEDGGNDFIVVKFIKDLDHIYIDRDESEAYPMYGANEKSLLWSEVINENVDDFMYGAYVNEIKPEEMLSVYHCVWVSKSKGFSLLVNGKSLEIT